MTPSLRPAKVALTALFSCAVAWPGSIFALGIRVADQDPQATARGNAFTATADNPSAVFYNPAGITQLEGQNASAGVYGVLMESHYKNAGVSFDTENDLQGLPQVYYTAKCPDYPVSFGLGFYSPYGFALEWPEGAPFFGLPKKGEINYLTLNPVLAYQVLPSLSVGAGPTLNYAQTDLRMEPAGPGSSFRFRGRDTDVGFNAGILWKPWEQHSFGINYRSATEMNFQGHADTQIPAIPFSQPGLDASAKFAFPRNVVLGYSFRPTPAWNLEFDADWTDWDTLDTVALRPLPTQLPFNWQSSWFYEFGATRTFENGWSVSGGYIYSENSVPDSSFSPLVPDSDRHIFSLGLGKKYKKISWNAAYQVAWGPTRTLDNPAGSPNALANGSYEYLSHALTFNVGFHF